MTAADLSREEVKALMRAVDSVLIPWRHNSEWEDLRAEGYLGMWRAVRRLPPETDRRCVRAYGMRAAKWQALNYLRDRHTGRLTTRTWFKQGREPVDLVPLEESSIPAAEEPFTDGGIEQVFNHVLGEQLWKWIIHHASPPQRRMLSLFFVRGLNSTQIGSIVGCGNGAVCTQIQRALNHGRRLMGEPLRRV